MEDLMQTDDEQILWYNRQTKTYQIVEVVGEINQENPALQDVIDPSIDDGLQSIAATEVNDSKNTLKNGNPANPSVLNNIWDKKQTLLLLELCEIHKEELNSPKFRKTEIYQLISSKMLEQGHQFSAEQIANRRKTLITKFKEIKDHNSRTVLQSMPDQATAIEKTPQPGASEAKKSDEKENDSKKRKVHVRGSPRTEIVKWLNEYKRDVERKEDRRLRLAEEQHSETKDVLEEILTLLKKE